MKLIFVCLLIELISEAYGKDFEKYRVTRGKPTSNGIRCLLKVMNDMVVAVRISDTNDDCVAMTGSWLKDRTYVAGYTYVEREPEEENGLVVFEEFTLTNIIGEQTPTVPSERAWTIPGIFGVGGRVELYFTTPPEDWNSFRIRIFNTAGPSFDLFDDLDELLLLSVRLALTQGIVEIKTFDENDKWNSAPDWTTFPFENEHTYKLTIVAQENHYQISFEGIGSTTLQYIAAPEIAKTIAFRFGHNQIWPFVENITFYGV